MNDPAFLRGVGMPLLLLKKQMGPWQSALHLLQAHEKEWKLRVTMVDPTGSETQGKVPEPKAWSFSLAPAPLAEQPWISPAGSQRLPSYAALITSLQPCSPGRLAICPHRSLESALLWAAAGCYWAALMWLKHSSQGLPYRILVKQVPLNSHPLAPLHLICKKCQAAHGTLPGSEPLCRFLFDIPFDHFHKRCKGEISISMSSPLYGHLRSIGVVEGKLSFYYLIVKMRIFLFL